MLSTIGPIVAAILLLNLCAFFAFGFDKSQARNSGWRISERSLLTLALAGGWLGAKSGQYYFRHKTHKFSFKSKLNAIPWLYALIVLGAFLAYMFMR